MVHKFDLKNKHKLDNEKRREVLPPDKTLLSLGLKEGDTVADIGCGIGYFTIPAAVITKCSGKVFAMDILPEMLQVVESKAKENNLSNITTVLTEENDFKIEENKVTFALICNVLHETEDKIKFLREVKRILSNGGRIAVIEWQKTESEFGPPLEHRLDKYDVKKILNEIGFTSIEIMDIGQYFYAITGVK